MAVLGAERRTGLAARAILGAGDVAAIGAFVALGLESHGLLDNWQLNLVRVSAPFVIGWFAVSPLTRVYSATTLAGARPLMARSALNWLAGITLGLALRGLVFREDVVPTFALITLLFTGLFVLGWRALFFVFFSRYHTSAG